MTVIKLKSFFKFNNSDLDYNQRGSSMTEILLVMGIMAVMAPFLYGQISETSNEIYNISIAKEIITTRDAGLNFVRLNQNKWPEVAQIKLQDDELIQITDMATAGFIDKYLVNNSTVTDMYLDFRLDAKKLRSAKVAKEIGTDAAIVSKDGIAYGYSWAVSAPEFKPGDLIYRISYDFTGNNNSRYLHRGTTGDDDLNVMKRNLNMGKMAIDNIATVTAESSKIKNTTARFLNSNNASAQSVYFSSGANIDGKGISIGTMRVSGDVTGFRSIYAQKINDDKFSANGSIIADRATVNNSLTVGKNLIIKSDSSKTISGFSGIVTYSLSTPYLYSDEIKFSNNFGLTVSGELMMSTVSPLKLGSWTFPSTTPPSFNSLKLSRANVPDMPNNTEFDKILQTGWKN